MKGERMLKASLALVLAYIAICYLGAAMVSAIELAAQIRNWISGSSRSSHSSLSLRDAITVAHNGKHP